MVIIQNLDSNIFYMIEIKYFKESNFNSHLRNSLPDFKLTTQNNYFQNNTFLDSLYLSVIGRNVSFTTGKNNPFAHYQDTSKGNRILHLYSQILSPKRRRKNSNGR